MKPLKNIYEVQIKLKVPPNNKRITTIPDSSSKVVK